LEQFARKPAVNPLVIRAQFGDVPGSKMAEVSGHTHAKAAANRSTGTFLIEYISSSIGRDAYFFQCSAADQRNGRHGSRTYHWIKDMNVRSELFSPSENDIMAMVDVDHYVDMNEFLTDNFQPLLVYTFQPRRVAREKGEFSYTFNAKNEVEYRVSGGGFYSHPVWNYSGDSLKFAKRFCGFAYKLSVYQLERKQMDEDHQLLLLAPLVEFSGLSAFVADIFLAGETLKRLQVAIGRYTRMFVQRNDGLTVSTGTVGGFSVAEVPASVDDELGSAMRTSKVGLSLPMVKKKMGDECTGAEILYEYHKLNTQSMVPQVTYHLDDRVRSYQWVEGDVDFEAKPAMVAFMDPIVDGAFVPAISKANDARAVRTRVVEQTNVTQITGHIMKVVDEFWKLALGDNVGTLRPVDEEYLFEKQSKPSQKRILHEAEFLDGNNRVKSFMKREAYSKINDPRLISTVNGPDKRDYSLFVYAMSEVIKEQEWYAFGKTPDQIAARVVEISENAKVGIVKSDLSRMDGNWSEVARYFERRGMMLAFRAEHHSEISELMDRLVRCNAVTKNGVWYDTGLSKLSGEAGTSTMNTAFNSFLCFSTFRAMRTSSGWIDKYDAWQRLGLYGGDDGFTADIVIHVYEKVCRKAGQKLEAAMVKRGEDGVDFLARQYSDQVWFGDVSSCCMFLRTLSKFHTTVHMPSNITQLDKLFDKSYALYLTDKNSPIVGEFVSKVVELCPTKKFLNLAGAWRETFDENKQYPNEEGEWMLARFREELPDFDVDSFRSWLSEATSLTDLLKNPNFMEKVEIEMKVGSVIVDCDIHTKASNPAPVLSPPVIVRQKRAVRRRTPGGGVQFRTKM
jgi:hypothetical protein